ncbi:MAG: hypothetical protein LBH44_13770 [Treponema sp.]|jgi:hypothetical protein|nr:hypothetical protein [Treponema sp.]
MGVSVEWREIKYRETFEEETRGLIRRRQSDPDCKIEDFEGILKSLYAMDGSDHDGRGSVQDTIMAATIAAYERFIAQWKAETSN